ncbi:bud22 [Hyphodiscus hymeniophilus]|uniref:Bud22 n=1 Tax=Hyphodiscus hymeniophilus TaxID=353542 RepID=A0A9P6SQB8_9HELO|nr:bud22 [Hyphodiscus hymeniophilus]
MPKRKRGAYEEDGDRVQSMRKKDAYEKLTQSKKLLHRALKTAKGFERQKLGKRLKNATASGSTDEATRINREIAALKGLNLDKMTMAQLHKSLLKVKAVADSELLPAEVKRELPKPEGTEEEIKALHNVTSGMWNMKPVKEIMEKIMSGMYIALGIPAPVGKSKGRVRKESDKKASKSVVVGVSRRAEEEEVEDLETSVKDGLGEPSWEGFESEDEIEGSDADGGAKIGDGDEEGDLDEETLSRYDALIGSSSDEESFDESNYDIKRPSQHSTQLALSLSPSPSLSEAQSQSLSPSPPPEKAPKTSKIKIPKAPPAKTGGSTFLPTLMGGYWSGSESSASDLEDAAPQIRKNRPGQMARRAIWEKKFGERANHIKQGHGAVAGKRGAGKDDGWDAKRGAKDSGGDRSRGRGRQRDFRLSTGDNTIALEPRKAGARKDDAGTLHPSWQAAKKAKEAKNTATFQGKKVTFD